MKLFERLLRSIRLNMSGRISSRRQLRPRSRIAVVETLERRNLLAGDEILKTYIIGNSLTGNLINPYLPDSRLSQLGILSSLA